MRLITPKAIISFPNLFEPRAMSEDDKKKFSATFLFETGTDLRPLVEAVIAVAKEKFGGDVEQQIKQGKIQTPFRRDLDSKPGYRERAGDSGVFINCRSDRRPGVVAAFADPTTGKPAAITDPAAIYPGMYVRGLITCYAYTHKMKKGVTFGLDGVQVLGNGERLDGRVAAEDAFEADPNASAEDFAALPGGVTDPAPAPAAAAAPASVGAAAIAAVTAPEVDPTDLLGSFLP